MKTIDDGRTADRLLNWINQQLSSAFSFEDEKYENEQMFWPNASDPGQVARAVNDVEEATSVALHIILRHKMVKPKTRASLIRFLQLLAVHHPSKRCRKGSADILVNFDYLWPSDLMFNNSQEVVAHESDVIKSFRICGNEVPRGYWIFCRGSKNNTRGFSCGLWVLLHSLSVRVDHGESHTAFRAICEFIHNFFVCEGCREHFYDMCSSVSTTLNTTRDFALWLWGAHNKVNERLMKEETALGTGDPQYPKMIWPPKSLCPLCYRSLSSTSIVHTDWNEDEVFKFLLSYYGKMLVSLSKEKGISDAESEELGADDISTTTNAVAVPVGAALAIAFASCAFGALAWFWRSQQKNRNRKVWKSEN